MTPPSAVRPAALVRDAGPRAGSHVPGPEQSPSGRATRLWRFLRPVRRIVVGVVGTVVVLIGIIIIPTPLPGIIVIPSGLAILATEFPWARRLLVWFRERGLIAWEQLNGRIRRQRRRRRPRSGRGPGDPSRRTGGNIAA